MNLFEHVDTKISQALSAIAFGIILLMVFAASITGYAWAMNAFFDWIDTLKNRPLQAFLSIMWWGMSTLAAIVLVNLCASDKRGRRR